MPGVTVDGNDPLAAGGWLATSARAGGPTLVESKVYRLSAHGNIIAPLVPCITRTRGHAVFGKREEYEAALRGSGAAVSRRFDQERRADRRQSG